MTTTHAHDRVFEPHAAAQSIDSVRSVDLA
jgi:hypothetical protein